jgi:hypothetical protein
VEFQLRMYRVKPGAMEQWLEEWRDGVLPLRRRHGFSVLGPWVVREESRFVWIVGHDGDFAAADRAYYDSPERAALDPPPTRHLDEITTLMMDGVPAAPTAAP